MSTFFCIYSQFLFSVYCLLLLSLFVHFYSLSHLSYFALSFLFFPSLFLIFLENIFLLLYNLFLSLIFFEFREEFFTSFCFFVLEKNPFPLIFSFYISINSCLYIFLIFYFSKGRLPLIISVLFFNSFPFFLSSLMSFFVTLSFSFYIIFPAIFRFFLLLLFFLPFLPSLPPSFLALQAHHAKTLVLVRSHS